MADYDYEGAAADDWLHLVTVKCSNSMILHSLSFAKAC